MTGTTAEVVLTAPAGECLVNAPCEVGGELRPPVPDSPVALEFESGSSGRSFLQVARTDGAVRRHRYAGRRHVLGRFGIEDQKQLVAAAIEQVPTNHFRERLEPQHVAIECLGNIQVRSIEYSLQDTLWLGHGAAPLDVS